MKEKKKKKKKRIKPMKKYENGKDGNLLIRRSSRGGGRTYDECAPPTNNPALNTMKMATKVHHESWTLTAMACAREKISSTEEEGE